MSARGTAKQVCKSGVFVTAPHLYGCWCESVWLVLSVKGCLLLEQHLHLAGRQFWVCGTPVRLKRCFARRCVKKGGWWRVVLSKRLSRFREHQFFFSLPPFPAGHTAQLTSYCCSLWRGSLSSLVYITYFFVSVCKCVKCIYNVLSLPVYYDTTIACDTFALGVLQVVSHALLLKQWFPCHCCHRYMRTILSPRVWRAQSCRETCVCWSRSGFLCFSPRGLQTKGNKKT